MSKSRRAKRAWKAKQQRELIRAMKLARSFARRFGDELKRGGRGGYGGGR